MCSLLLSAPVLFVSGESYAGIYVPTLAWNIMTRENSINMKGFMVGHMCTCVRTHVCVEFCGMLGSALHHFHDCRLAMVVMATKWVYAPVIVTSMRLSSSTVTACTAR